MDRQKCCLNLSVQPSRGMVDEKFTVLVQNCPPGFQLTIYARHKADDGHSYEAFAHYCASTSGSVNGLWFDPDLGGSAQLKVGDEQMAEGGAAFVYSFRAYKSGRDLFWDSTNGSTLESQTSSR